jgi:hypothetical protein
MIRPPFPAFLRLRTTISTSRSKAVRKPIRRSTAYSRKLPLNRRDTSGWETPELVGDTGIGVRVMDCTPVVRQRNQGQVAIDAVGGRLRAAANGDKFASNSMGGR